MGANPVTIRPDRRRFALEGSPGPGDIRRVSGPERVKLVENQRCPIAIEIGRQRRALVLAVHQVFQLVASVESHGRQRVQQLQDAQQDQDIDADQTNRSPHAS